MPPTGSQRGNLRIAGLAVFTVVLSWLWMMAVHEFGHVLHAWLSGGSVERVVLHPLALSRTDVAPNPHPLFVAWGGPVWGCLLPLVAWLLARRWKGSHLLAFFAGFCLIANGGYLAAGAVMPVGDADVLLRLGTPVWLLLAFGAATIPTGLWVWNGRGDRFGIGPDAQAPEGPTLLAVAVLTVATVVLELLF